MVKVGKKIVKFRVPILILSIILLIPAVWGYVNTRINYDVLTYLPEDIETMQGQEIMTNDFGIGAFSMLMVDGMEDKEIVKLKEKVEKVDGVENVLWYDSLADISVPQSVLPSKLYDEYNTEDGTMMAVFFKDGTSSDETMKAITEIRKITGEQCFLSGMSAIVEDTKELAEKEIEALQGQLDNVYSFFERGTYTEKIFKQRSSAIEQQIMEIGEKIDRLKAEHQQVLERQNVQAEFVPSIKHLLEIYDTLEPVEKNKWLKQIIDRIVYEKNADGKYHNVDPGDFTLGILPRLPKRGS